MGDRDQPGASQKDAARIAPIRAVGLAAGPVLAVFVYLLLPAGFSHQARATAAVASLMAIWWFTEAIPLSATALLPIVLFPLLGVLDIADAAAPYADKVIFLFLGGFILGLAMERWNLHQRIALITILIVGTQPKRLIAGFMIATAVMSAWVSNTATAAMMVPIGMSLVTLMRRGGSVPTKDVSAFAGSVMLGIAYAASVGGVTTLIGTPPNGVLKSFVESELGWTISFQSWLVIGLPAAAIMLPLVWLYLTRLAFPSALREIPGGRSLIREQLAALGPVSRGEWSVLVVFTLTALAWMTRPQLVAWLGLPYLTDEGIAVAAAIALFLIPVSLRRGEFAMDWKTAERLPYGILLLFGGGLSLAAAIGATGLDKIIGEQFQILSGLPVWLVVLVVALVVVFATELTSNTALTSALMPVLAGAAAPLGVPAEFLLVPAALAASFAFMLPVATPPNAIVFGSGEISAARMARAGFTLNLIGAIVVTLVTLTLGGTLR